MANEWLVPVYSFGVGGLKGERTALSVHLIPSSPPPSPAIKKS